MIHKCVQSHSTKASSKKGQVLFHCLEARTPPCSPFFGGNMHLVKCRRHSHTFSCKPFCCLGSGLWSTKNCSNQCQCRKKCNNNSNCNSNSHNNNNNNNNNNNKNKNKNKNKNNNKNNNDNDNDNDSNSNNNNNNNNNHNTPTTTTTTTATTLAMGKQTTRHGDFEVWNTFFPSVVFHQDTPSPKPIAPFQVQLLPPKRVLPSHVWQLTWFCLGNEAQNNHLSRVEQVQPKNSKCSWLHLW